eukprot:2847200-Pleurochrysis_carterae.AAC.2
MDAVTAIARRVLRAASSKRCERTRCCVRAGVHLPEAGAAAARRQGTRGARRRGRQARSTHTLGSTSSR